jgi:hypothetical protein
MLSIGSTLSCEPSRIYPHSQKNENKAKKESLANLFATKPTVAVPIRLERRVISGQKQEKIGTRFDSGFDAVFEKTDCAPAF